MKTRRFFPTAVGLLLAVFGNETPAARGRIEPITTYYVATTGSDSNPGTEEQPWRTIQHASLHIAGGDTVVVKDGAYNEVVTINSKNGAASAWTTIRAQNVGGAIIDGAGMTYSWYDGLVTITNCAYLRLSGFRIMNASGVGVMTHGYASHDITYDHNTLYNISDAGFSWYTVGETPSFTNNITVEYNTLTQVCNGNNGAAIPSGECISGERLNNYVFQYNTISECEKEGINNIECRNGVVRYNHINCTHTARPFNEECGLYISGWYDGSSDIKMYGNFVEGRCIGIQMYGEHGGAIDNVWIYNNLIHITGDGTHGYYGIADGCESPRSNIYIYNNTIRTQAYEVTPIAIRDAESLHTNIQIINNILAGEGYYVFAAPEIPSDSPALVRYNNLYYNDVYPLRTHYLEMDNYFEPTAVKANPQCYNIDADWHLTDISPAIDAGRDVTLSVDYDGNPRPHGAHYDIGAYEFPSSTPAPPPVTDSGVNAARFSKGAGNLLYVTYDATNCRAQKLIIVYNALGAWSGYSGCAQVDGGCSGSTTVDSTGQNNVWYNLVWTNGTTAGHPGFATNGPRTWNVGTLCGMASDDHSQTTCP